MFVEFDADRWNEPISCRNCKAPILSSHETKHLQLPFDGEHALHELNGLYHVECVKPYLSMIRAMNSLGGLAL